MIKRSMEAFLQPLCQYSKKYTVYINLIQYTHSGSISLFPKMNFITQENIFSNTEEKKKSGCKSITPKWVSAWEYV